MVVEKRHISIIMAGIIYCMVNPYNIEVRRVQALHGERSLTLVFPKEFALELGIGKGDFLKCHIDSNRLIVEKVKVNDQQEI